MILHKLPKYTEWRYASFNEHSILNWFRSFKFVALKPIGLLKPIHLSNKNARIDYTTHCKNSLQCIMLMMQTWLL